MNRNQFLIPANTKKGGLIFNLFQPIDAMIFGIGIATTILILVILSILNLTTGFMSILALVPGLTAGVLVFPIPYYHNVRNGLKDLIAFYTNRQKYVWRGWCVAYEFKDK